MPSSTTRTGTLAIMSRPALTPVRRPGYPGYQEGALVLRGPAQIAASGASVLRAGQVYSTTRGRFPADPRATKAVVLHGRSVWVAPSG